MESLRAWTYQQLSGLSHSNGLPLLKMFGAHQEGPKHQGGIFQFQVCVMGRGQKAVAETGMPAGREGA